jgi:hypothetical protein
MTETGILVVMDEGEPMAIEAKDAIDLAKYIIRHTIELKEISSKEIYRNTSKGEQA